MTTEELFNKLSKKYPSPQYAFLGQVRNHTGFYNQEESGTRTADALALGLWPSRGNLLIGFELKISRSDWLHELKNPIKAEGVVKYCDQFFLVVSSEDIYDLSEVPVTWGIMSIRSGVLKTVREAPVIKAEPMSRAFLCGFMRKVDENIKGIYIPRVEVEKRIEDSVKQKIESVIERSSYKAGLYDKLVENLEKFEASSGLNLKGMNYEWSNPEKIGSAVKIILNEGYKGIARDLVWLKERLKTIQEDIDDELKGLPESLTTNQK